MACGISNIFDRAVRVIQRIYNNRYYDNNEMVLKERYQKRERPVGSHLMAAAVTPSSGCVLLPSTTKDIHSFPTLCRLHILVLHSRCACTDTDTCTCTHTHTHTHTRCNNYIHHAKQQILHSVCLNLISTEHTIATIIVAIKLPACTEAHMQVLGATVINIVDQV